MQEETQDETREEQNTHHSLTESRALVNDYKDLLDEAWNCSLRSEQARSMIEEILIDDCHTELPMTLYVADSFQYEVFTASGRLAVLEAIKEESEGKKNDYLAKAEQIMFQIVNDQSKRRD